VAAANAHPDLFSNPPYIPPLTTALATLATANTNAVDGGSVALANVVTAAQEVRNLLSQHAGWVQRLANNATPEQGALLITTAAFSLRKTPVRVKKEAGASNTKVSGVVAVRVVTVANALLYFWEMCSDQKSWTKALDTEHTTGTVSGLTAGQTYLFRYRAYVRGKGYTGDSQVYSLMVT
jgi:hypothetical protein